MLKNSGFVGVKPLELLGVFRMMALYYGIIRQLPLNLPAIEAYV